MRRWVESRSQEAFTEIGRRYAGLVFQVCLRETGERTLAEDASQAVFLLLAQKAPKLRREGTLAGWLFRAAQLVSRSLMRQERRRREREIQASQDMATDCEATANENALWNEIAPHLNTALSRLKPVDREAILLRCLQGHSLAETGSALGVTENTARMRVSRALDKIRIHLAKAGITVSLSTLAFLLWERGAQAAPASFTQAIAHIAAAGTGGMSGAAFVTSKTASTAPQMARAHMPAKGGAVLMAITTAKTAAAITGGLVLLVIGGTMVSHFCDPLAGYVQVAVVPKNQVKTVENLLSRSGVLVYGEEAILPSMAGWRIKVPPRYANVARQALAKNNISSNAETPGK